MTDHKQRTIQQNKALHLYCQMLSDALNDAGLDMKKTLRPEIDLPWSGYTIKEFIWKPIQEGMTGKHSTTEMDSVNPGDIYETINRHMTSKFGIYVEWPSRS